MKLIKELKSGQVVVLTHEGTRIAGILEKNSINRWNICQNYYGYADNIVNRHGFKYWLPLCGNGEDTITRYQIIPLTEDISCVYQGARITDGNYTREILSVSGRVVAISTSADYDKYGVKRTIEELRWLGYKLILPDKVKGEKQSLVGEEVEVKVAGKKYKAKIIE